MAAVWWAGIDSVSTIMMEPGLRDISRMHIVIEKFDEQTIQVTDLSSHGTYIQNKYLENNTGSWPTDITLNNNCIISYYLMLYLDSVRMPFSVVISQNYTLKLMK